MPLLTLLLAASAIGCGPKGPQRYEHWGTITFQGKPIPAGEIRFDPDLVGNDGPAGYAVIKNGQFDTRLRSESGAGAGKYRARVFAADGIEAPEAPVGKMIFSSQVEISLDLPAADSDLGEIVIPPGTR